MDTVHRLGKSFESMMKVQESKFFKKAIKDFERGKRDIIQGIDDEKYRSGRSTLEIIRSFTDNDEDTYWLWLMYTINLKINGKKGSVKKRRSFFDVKRTERFSHFSGKCALCDKEITFTDEEQRKGDIKCHNCGQTYSEDDMYSFLYL